MTPARFFALSTACAALAASPASAKSKPAHLVKYRSAKAGRAQPNEVAIARPRYGTFPGEAVEAAAARAQAEPGVTEQLSPSARQSATGGPSGGVPGFSGGM